MGESLCVWEPWCWGQNYPRPPPWIHLPRNQIVRGVRASFVENLNGG